MRFRAMGLSGLVTSLIGLGLAVPTAAEATPAATFNVPLSSLGAATPASHQTGTLTPGLTYDVDRGTWNTGGQGYIVVGGQSQTWTFSAPVQVAFSVAGLNCTGESAGLPASAVVVSLNSHHHYNATTHVVVGSGAAASDASSFQLTGYVTTFTWTAPTLSNCGRGLTALALTYQPVDAQPDAPVTAQGEATEFDPSENDTMTDGSTSSTVQLIDPANPTGPPVNTVTTSDGTYTVTPSGTVSYTPDPAFVGTASPLTYVITDSNGVSGTSTITMTVAAIVAAPLTKPLGGAAAGLIALLGGGLVLARRHKSRVQA